MSDAQATLGSRTGKANANDGIASREDAAASDGKQNASLGAASAGFSLILVSPLPVFLRHQQWSIWSLDGLVLLMLTLGVSLVVFLLPVARTRIGCSLIYSLALVFFVDFQYRLFVGRYSYLLAVLLGFAVCWVLFRSLPKLVFAVFGAMTVASLVPVPSPEVPHRAASELPPIVHLVVDEHAGLAGLPDSGRGGQLKQRLRSAYVGRGFRVFENAFTLSDQTITSLPAILNGSSLDDGLAETGAAGTRIRRSTYFTKLQDQGYGLRVNQSDRIDYCNMDTLKVDACSSYGLWGLRPVLSGLPRFSPRRIVSVGLVVAMRSRLLSRIRTVYEERRVAAGSAWPRALPGWPHISSSGAEAASRALIEVTESAKRTQGGEVFFAHLLSPHHPFLYASDCRLKRQEDWHGNQGADESIEVVTNSYYDQIDCLTQQIGATVDALLQIDRFQDATILVHGDHGARLLIATPSSEATSAEQTDALTLDLFSSFLAVRAPGVKPALDRRPLSINQFIAETWALGSWDGVPRLTSYFSKALKETEIVMPAVWRSVDGVDSDLAESEATSP